MDKAYARHGNNKSRYDGEVFLDSVSKLHREENCNATWILQIGGLVRLSQVATMEAVVVNGDQGLAQLRRGKSRHQMRTKVSEVH